MSQFSRDLAFQIITSPVFMNTLIDIADKLIEKHCQSRYGGDSVFFPKTSAHHDKTQRNQIIRAKFNGHNLAELEKTFGLTTRQLRRIVRSK